MPSSIPARPRSSNHLARERDTWVCWLLRSHPAPASLLVDAEVWITGRLYLLELDRGSMGYAQVERRFRKYEDCPHLSLWVCATEARREGLRLRAERLRHTALFTTFAEALASPHGDIW